MIIHNIIKEKKNSYYCLHLIIIYVNNKQLYDVNKKWSLYLQT